MKEYRPICIYDKSRVTQDFGLGCGAIVLETPEEYLENIDNFLGPLIIRGVAPIYAEAQGEAKRRGRDFYNIDNGYFGNIKKKIWFRVTKNNLQLGDKVYSRKLDRLKMININLKDWKRDGSKILVCQPSEWSAMYFGYSVDGWTDATVKKVRKHTDRVIEVRKKPIHRRDRLKAPTSIEYSLEKDIFCTVTSNSLIATESVINGIPTFVTEPNAASPVALKDLSKMETPIYPGRKKWLKHLAYGQFTREEMIGGTAWDILNNHFD